MDEKPTLGQLLRLLGYENERGPLEKRHLDESFFPYRPAVLRRFAVSLASEFRSDGIDTVVGVGAHGYALALALADALIAQARTCSSVVRRPEIYAIDAAVHKEMGLVPLGRERELVFVKKMHVLVAAPYADRQSGLGAFVERLWKAEASAVSCALIANFRCSERDLRLNPAKGGKIRSLAEADPALAAVA